MKPFFNLGCALVAWGELCRVARLSQRPGYGAPQQAFRQGRHNRQFLCAAPTQLPGAYRALLLEPLWLLERNRDGRWLLSSTSPGNSLNLRLQALLRGWLPAMPQAEEAGPAIARLRLVLRGNSGDASPLPLRPGRSAVELEPLTRGIGAYLEQVSSIVQLEDSLDGRLLAGGVNLRGPRPQLDAPGGDGWQDLLVCDWQQLLQYADDTLAAG
ncbi:hypothetical protein ACPRNU_08220 [Chromobacterium vaccinii]|uniref:hypothetical protein n=1 Tax=Chromobacterium vaccinii TaxID=1108595 RepID=UPI003C7820E0